MEVTDKGGMREVDVGRVRERGSEGEKTSQIAAVRGSRTESERESVAVGWSGGLWLISGAGRGVKKRLGRKVKREKERLESIRAGVAANAQQPR
jgi:hypothetical protein